jgi:hypothetical protein
MPVLSYKERLALLCRETCMRPYDWYAAALSAWDSCHCHSFCVWRFDRTMVRPNPNLAILILV